MPVFMAPLQRIYAKKLARHEPWHWQRTKCNKYFNLIFQFDRNSSIKHKPELNEKSIDIETAQDMDDDRPTWASPMQFLMSCIQTSVGLGNIWRFPFAAYENGGGAFLIPYIIVLFIIGKPMYYLEMFLGQFTSKTAIKVFSINPALRGIGVGSLVSSIAVGTYYSSLIALTLYYFFASFAWVLPWSQCREEWGSTCVDSQPKELELFAANATNQSVSSSELYFLLVQITNELLLSMSLIY